MTDIASILRALTHELRPAILRKVAAVEQPASPSVLAKELEQSLGTVSYHVRQLAALGLLRQVKTKPRRGAVEHFYALTALGDKALAAVEGLEEAMR